MYALGGTEPNTESEDMDRVHTDVEHILNELAAVYYDALRVDSVYSNSLTVMRGDGLELVVRQGNRLVGGSRVRLQRITQLNVNCKSR